MRTATDAILAIDLWRYKCVGCVYADPHANTSFLTFITATSEIGTLLAQHHDWLVAIKACAKGVGYTITPS